MESLNESGETSELAAHAIKQVTGQLRIASVVLQGTSDTRDHLDHIRVHRLEERDGKARSQPFIDRCTF